MVAKQLTATYEHLYACLEELTLDSWLQRALKEVLKWAQCADETNLHGSASLVTLAFWTCAGVGGQTAWAVPVAASWRALYLAAHLFDRVEDNHPQPANGPLKSRAQMVSVATSLLFLASIALEPLTQLKNGHNTFIQVRRCLDRAALEACNGQHTDLMVQQKRCRISPQKCLAIMAEKSGRVFAVACQMGAIVGRANAERVRACTEFGYNLGIVGQIADDWLALTAPPEKESSDLACSMNLAVAYAYNVLPAVEKKHLSFLLAGATTDDCLLAQARQMLLDAGSSLYLITQSQLFQQRAREALELATLETIAHQSLELLLDQASLVTS